MTATPGNYVTVRHPKDRHLPIPERADGSAAVVRGHIAYYAVPGNIDVVGSHSRTQVTRHWQKALRAEPALPSRRETMSRIATRWLPACPDSCIPSPPCASTLASKAGAQCGSPARWDCAGAARKGGPTRDTGSMGQSVGNRSSDRTDRVWRNTTHTAGSMASTKDPHEFARSDNHPHHFTAMIADHEVSNLVADFLCAASTTWRSDPADMRSVTAPRPPPGESGVQAGASAPGSGPVRSRSPYPGRQH